MPKQRRKLYKVRCPDCTFQSERIQRENGFGVCPDCGAALVARKTREEYNADPAMFEQLAEARAARFLKELHDPRHKLATHQKKLHTTIRRYGRNYFSDLARWSHIARSRKKRKRKVS